MEEAPAQFALLSSPLDWNERRDGLWKAPRPGTRRSELEPRGKSEQCLNLASHSHKLAFSLFAASIAASWLLFLLLLGSCSKDETNRA